jgi:hypothetical protein
MSETVTTGHQPMEAVPERPTEPNAGLVRYEPGSHHPLHKHDFAQVCSSCSTRGRRQAAGRSTTAAST